jgi:hypothetical protein
MFKSIKSSRIPQPISLPISFGTRKVKSKVTPPEYLKLNVDPDVKQLAQLNLEGNFPLDQLLVSKHVLQPNLNWLLNVQLDFPGEFPFSQFSTNPAKLQLTDLVFLIELNSMEKPKKKIATWQINLVCVLIVIITAFLFNLFYKHVDQLWAIGIVFAGGFTAGLFLGMGLIIQQEQEESSEEADLS